MKQVSTFRQARLEQDKKIYNSQETSVLDLALLVASSRVISLNLFMTNLFPW